MDWNEKFNLGRIRLSADSPRNLEKSGAVLPKASNGGR
jgi:hypothetical protein